MVAEKFQNSSKEDYLTIEVNTQDGYVTDIWDGAFGSQENFRKGLDRVVELLKEHSITKWLADLRKMKGSFDSSQDWIAKNLVPKAMKAGLKNQAIVIPKDVFSKLSTKDTITKIQGLEIRQFDDYDKAVAWLSTK